MRRMNSCAISRSATPSAAASRLRLPETAATISYCSAPARLKWVAFGVASITALRSASATGSSWTSTSPISASLRDEIAQPEFFEIDARRRP